MGNHFVTIEEISRLTGFPVRSIYQFVHENDIPFYKKRRRLRFVESEVIGWMREGKRKPRTKRAPAKTE